MFKKKCILKLFFLGMALLPTIPASVLADGSVNHNPESLQQTRKKISGIVKDDVEPLVGVSVAVKGTSIGTTTDIDGKYNLEVPVGGTLVFSYISYITQEIKIDSRENYDVLMAVDTKTLDEVVVVGYGVQKKSDITGAMVNVKEDIIKQAPVANIASALQGLASGVDVQMAGGNTHPGAVPQIRIRGERSINATNDVLIIVDGIPFSGSLNDISNDDIQSVNILKDASATAIYGSRGANGVLLITTKKGTKNKLNVSYNGYYGVTTAIDDFPIMGRDKYMRLKQWANYNANPTKYTGPDDPSMMVIGVVFRDQDEMDGYYAGNDTDWQSLIFENGMTTNQQVALNGGSEKTTYNASVGYYETQNNYRGHNFERMTSKLSVDSEINDYLTVGLSSMNTYSYNKGQDVDPMDQALRASPFTTPYKEDGTLRSYLPGSGQQVWNPLLDSQEGAVVDDRKTLSTFTTGYAEVKLPLGLKYHFNGGIMYKQASIGKYQKSITTKRMGGQNYAFSESRFYSDYTLENLLTWDKSINKVHNLSATALFSLQQQQTNMNNINSYNYFDDNVQYYNPSKALGAVSGDGDYEKSDLISYMGRLNYSFKEKYLLTATIRYDGSSHLAEGNKWHAFPSVALGWNIFRESFMNNVDFMSGLKLRGSWGNVGSTSVNAYQTIARLSDNKYMLGSGGVMGVYPGTVPDNSLTWENTETFNIGLDFGFLNNRITGTFEAYRQLTTDLLLPVSLPPTSGYSSNYLTNLGETENKGLELNISTINIAGDGKKKLSWSTDFNIYGNRNKVVNLGDGVQSNSDQNLYLGKDRWAILSLEADGIWQDTPEDIALAKTFGYQTTGSTSVIGTIKVKNNHIDYVMGSDGKPALDQDGNPILAVQKINDDDRVFIGKRFPDFEGGINNRFAFMNFDFSFLFTFKSGGILTSDMHNGWMNTMQGGYNNLNIDYWTPDNTGARWPKPSTGTISQKGLLARYDASYIKLRNISLGYTIPSNILNKMGIQNARIYASSDNLYTWFSSEYKKDGGMDPETTSTIGLVTPPMRSFIFGLNVTF